MSNQLYLSYTGKVDETFLDSLQNCLAQHAVSMLSIDLRNSDLQLAHKVKTICLSNKVALIIANDLEKAIAIDADGFHLETEADDYDKLYKDCRAKLGSTKILGISCFKSKDRAMACGEEKVDADYVLFGSLKSKDSDPQIQQLINWWDEYTILPYLVDPEYVSADSGINYVHYRIDSNCKLPF